MSRLTRVSTARGIGPLVTLLAIACAAFFVADVAHEGLGHGGACVAAGGRVLSLSTTYEYCSVRSRWIDAAGPGAGIMVALLAFAWLRWATPRSPNARAFLYLTFAFAIFWNVGYMVYSGLLDRGDWKFVIAGLKPTTAWYAGLVVCGVVFYRVTMRILRTLLARNLADTGAGVRAPVFASVAFLGAVALAGVGAAFDPRGAGIILTDALPAALSSFGLVWVGFLVEPQRRIETPTSLLWVAAGVACAAIFIGVLGPGLQFAT